MKRMLRIGLLPGMLFLTAACGTPKTPEAAQDVTVVDTIPVDTTPDAAPDATTDAAAEIAGPDVAKDVPVDVGPPLDVTYITNVEAASDPTGAQATVGQNAQLSADLDLVYPPENALAPLDFAPITVQWKYAGTDANVFVVRFDNDQAELDVIGDATALEDSPGYSVTVPKDIWQKLFAFPGSTDWKLRVLAAKIQNKTLVGQMQSSKPVNFHVSNQKVGGAIYYWNTSLQAIRVLEYGQLQATTIGGGGMFACTGCHSVSPDGSTLATSSFFDMSGGFGTMTMKLISGKSGTPLSWLSPKAASTLASSFTISAAFSPAYFTPVDKWLVVPMAGSLKSLNLLTGDLKTMVKSGDLGQQAFATWSNDGNTVVYASAKDVGNGFQGNVPTALYSVPFNGGQGGNATAISGADEPGMFHYYPAFTPDSKYVVYNRADPSGPSCAASAGGGPGTGQSGASTYDNCNAELWAIDSSGGTAIRLDYANQSMDPLTNSWPTIGNVVGQYYWMAFSSKRDYGFKHTGNPATPQIYIAAIDPLKLAQGLDGSYAALWLPGQDMTSGCHIARWSAKPRD